MHVIQDLGDNWVSGFSDRHGGYEAYEEDMSREMDDHMAPTSEPMSRTPLALRPFVPGGQADEGRWSLNPMRRHHQVPVVCNIVCVCWGGGGGWVGCGCIIQRERERER
jgi:hypothetical protein